MTYSWTALWKEGERERNLIRSSNALQEQDKPEKRFIELEKPLQTAIKKTILGNILPDVRTTVCTRQLFDSSPPFSPLDHVTS